MNRPPEVTPQPRTRANAPRRLTAESPPSLLVAGRDAELRLFLRGSLQQWCRIAQASTRAEVMSHLEHCPPEGLIAGPLGTGATEGLIAALREPEAPPVLKLWATSPPGDWADETLRHPFTRADLLRAVDRLVYAEEPDRPSDEVPGPEEVELRTHAQS